MAFFPVINVLNLTVESDDTWYGDVYIFLYDENSNPVNGDGVEITYTETFKSFVNTETVNVYGQSLLIYSGYVKLENFVRSFQIISTSGSNTPPTPPPAVCDLVISSVQTLKVESAPGAADAQIKINARTSNGPIDYSIDNVNWQGSLLFSGLAGGSGIAYVKDALGCTASMPYFISTANDILVSDPSIDLGNGNISRWNAAFNPIYFIYQRKDFQVISLVQATDGSGKVLVTLNSDLTGVKARSIVNVSGNNITVNGDFIYLKTPNYEGVFEVLSVAGSVAKLDVPYTQNNNNGFANINALRPYYEIQTRITFVNLVGTGFKTITIKNQPLTNGYARCDFSSFLRSLLEAKDKSAYNLTNYRDMQLSASYQVEYAEVWDGHTPIWVSISEPFYVVYAAKQIGESGGGNLKNYVPYLLGFQPAKWLSDFKNPVYSYGFPFDIGFLFSEYMTGTAPYYQVTLLDINKQPLLGQSTTPTFLATENGAFLLTQGNGKFIIADPGISSVPIAEHVGLNRLLINFNPPADCYWFKVELKYDNNGNTYALTEPIICRIQLDTPDRPVYLRWIGLNGSWNYYKFVYDQQIDLEVNGEVLKKNFIIDWENTDGIEDVISTNAVEKMTVYAENVTVDDIIGLQSVKYSPKVQILLSASPVKWQTVIVNRSTFNERRTMLKEGSFSITFNFPSKNIQTQ